MSTSLYPRVLWADRNDTAFITVDIQDATDLNVDLSEKELHFSAVSMKNLYKFDLSFPKEIDLEKSKYYSDRVVRILIYKKESGRWDNITTEPGKKHWLACDWDKWQDSDDENDKGFDDGKGFFNMEDLMKGGGGFPGGEDEEEEPEDFEDEKDDDEEEEEEEEQSEDNNKNATEDSKPDEEKTSEPNPAS